MSEIQVVSDGFGLDIIIYIRSALVSFDYKIRVLKTGLRRGLVFTIPLVQTESIKKSP
jgi:hypothetical protein